MAGLLTTSELFPFFSEISYSRTLDSQHLFGDKLGLGKSSKAPLWKGPSERSRLSRAVYNSRKYDLSLHPVLLHARPAYVD